MVALLNRVKRGSPRCRWRKPTAESGTLCHSSFHTTPAEAVSSLLHTDASGLDGHAYATLENCERDA